MLVIPALGNLRQEDCRKFKSSLGFTSEFKLSLDYTVRPCLKNTKQNLEVTLKLTSNFFDGSWVSSLREQFISGSVLKACACRGETLHKSLPC